MKQEKSRIVIDSNEKNKMQIKLKSAAVVSDFAMTIKRPLIIPLQSTSTSKIR